MLIFKSSGSQMFFKIGVLKNFATFTGKDLWWPLQAFFYRIPTVVAYGFSRQQILFFSAESGIYCWQLHRLLLRFLRKHELKPQKQPLELFKKRCCKKFFKFHRKTILLKSLFNRVAGLQVCSFIKKRLQHRCFPVEFTKLLRTPNLAP